MRQLAIFTVLCLAFSFACKEKDTSIRIKSALPGILKGRPDSTEDKYFIKRYIGHLGNSDSIQLDLLLVNWGDGRLSGHTYYPNHNGLLNFEGRLESDGHFELVEERFQERNASFSGTFLGADSLQGTWWNVDSTHTLPFTYKEYISPFDNNHWTGVWHLNDPWDTSTLIVGGVTENSLQFAMNIYINNYTHQFFGTADIRGDRAIMDLELFRLYHENCKLVFYRRGKEIYLQQESFPFLCGLGPNCWLTGSYQDIYTGQEARIDFIGKDSIFKDTASYQAFYHMVGQQNLSKFAYNMERLEQHPAKDEKGNTYGTLWKGRVRGFHREKEAIIIFDSLQNIWAATTSPPDTTLGHIKIHYFTNNKSWKRKVPFEIKAWLKDYYDYSIVYERD